MGDASPVDFARLTDSGWVATVIVRASEHEPVVDDRLLHAAREAISRPATQRSFRSEAQSSRIRAHGANQETAPLAQHFSHFPFAL